MSVLKNACTCWGLAKHLDCPSIQEWMWPGGISRVCVWLHPQRGIFEMPMTSRNHWLFEGYFCLWSELRCSESKVVLVYSISIQLSLGIWNMEMYNSMFFPAKYCIQLGKERKKKNLKKQTNKKNTCMDVLQNWERHLLKMSWIFFFNFFSLALPSSFLQVCRRTFSLSGQANDAYSHLRMGYNIFRARPTVQFINFSHILQAGT